MLLCVLMQQTEYFERSDDAEDDDAEDDDAEDDDTDADVVDNDVNDVDGDVNANAEDGGVNADADDDGVEGEEVEQDMAVLSIDDSAGLDQEVTTADAINRSTALEHSSSPSPPAVAAAVAAAVEASSIEALVPNRNRKGDGGGEEEASVSVLSAAVDEGASMSSSVSSIGREGLFNRATTRDLKLPQVVVESSRGSLI